MGIYKNSGKILVWVLWLVCIHSVFTGIALIFMPTPVYAYFGFEIGSRFFPTQGGVFHLVMGIAYAMAASDIVKNRGLVILSYTTKFMATIFLLTWFFLMKPIPLVFLSMIVDFLMGFVIFVFHRLYLSHKISDA